MMIRDHGASIKIFQPFRDFEGLTCARRAKAFDWAKCKFDQLQVLGTNQMLVCCMVAPTRQGASTAATDAQARSAIAARKASMVPPSPIAWPASGTSTIRARPQSWASICDVAGGHSRS